MALNRLTTAEMISVSAPWVKPGSEERELLLGYPETAGVVPRVDAAHQGLLATQPKPAATGRLTEISEQSGRLDLRHDTTARGLDLLFGGIEALAPDVSTAEDYVKLHQLLLPQGMSATQRTYRDEAGQGALLKERLTPEVRTTLGNLRTPFGTVLEVVDEWIAVAIQLGGLEDERARLAEARPAPPTQADVATARHRWVRAVNA
ncbi:MAG: hypothetical protein HY906_21435, partial [Deltaproteobacteria bacterium]|nr:hypothetical protein [Deltaproteobacteria bacterium]